MRFALLASVSFSCLLAAPAFAERAVVVDSATFVVTQGQRTLGTETFQIEQRGDSLVMQATVRQTVSTPEGDAQLEKALGLVASAFDYGLKRYESHQVFRGRQLSRAVMVAGETTLSVYRQVDQAGEGTVVASPPGRLFIIDPMMFSLFDLMCRSLHDRTFETRPLSVFVLGPTDSLLEARVTDLGKETIRWGAKPVQTRKFRIGDDATSFIAWIGPGGGVLRLQQPEQELLIERQPPAVKKRRSPRGG